MHLNNLFVSLLNVINLSYSYVTKIHLFCRINMIYVFVNDLLLIYVFI